MAVPAGHSHRPKSHPRQHSASEYGAIKEAFREQHFRYGWDGVYDELVRKHGYTRSFSGMYRAACHLALGKGKKRKPPRKELRRYPELTRPGEKVQIDVKEVPYCCLEEHAPENSVDFLHRVIAYFPFPIETKQTGNGTEFTYRYISEEVSCPFEKRWRDPG